MNEVNETVVKERPHSIKVNRNAKKDYSFEVKLYANNEEIGNKTVIDNIDRIYSELKVRFKNGK